MSSHSPANDGIQIDDPEPGSTWFFSLAGSIVFVVIVLALCVLYFQVNATHESEVMVNVPVTAVETAKTAQKAKLASPGPWVEESYDSKGQLVRTDRQRIGIEDAMKIVAAELSGAQAGNHAGGGAK